MYLGGTVILGPLTKSPILKGGLWGITRKDNQERIYSSTSFKASGRDKMAYIVFWRGGVGSFIGGFLSVL